MDDETRGNGLFTATAAVLGSEMEDPDVNTVIDGLCGDRDATRSEIWELILEQGATLALAGITAGEYSLENAAAGGGLSLEAAAAVDRIVKACAPGTSRRAVIAQALSAGLQMLEEHAAQNPGGGARRAAGRRNPQAQAEAARASRHAGGRGRASAKAKAADAARRAVEERTALNHGMELPLTAAVQRGRERGLRLVSRSQKTG